MSIFPGRPTCINTNARRAAVMTKSMTNQPRGSSPDLPKWVKPQLCKLVDAPPQGPEWLHEIKYDGYRMHARLDHGRGQLLTRTGLDGRINTRP
jgi:bifunctional non-homologous end joining protein LigD